MKKAKILAVFGILLAMGITACTGGSSAGGDDKSQEAPKTQESAGGDSQEASEHKHSFGEWKQTKAPTCTEKGEEEQTCECGEKKTRSVNALGHDWGEWTVKTAASCTEDGEEERACKRAGCDAKETRAIKAAHEWDEEQAVDAGADPADQVGYSLANCKKGDAVKVDLKAVDAKFYKGGIKSGTPSGYFKLNAKNDKAYWKFTLAGTKMYKGMLYQRGAMDSFSSNTTKSYASTSTSGDNAPEYTKGNFDCVVNGDSLDKTEWIRIPFEELLADGEDSSAMGDNYSPLCVVPIGEAILQPGLNEITYERLGSYNLIISDLIFIGSEFEHVHAAAAEYSSDDTQHWHACTAPGCPSKKADTPANHTFGEWEEVKAASCKEAGERQHACTVCGKVVKEEVAKLAHTLGDAHDVVPATCLDAGSQKRTCSVCNEVVDEVLPKLDHNFGEAVASNAAGDGYIATTAHNCPVCNKSALRWNAKDYKADESQVSSDTATNSYVRFADNGLVENKGGTESAGSHIIYYVNVDAAQDKAGLAFKIINTNGNSGVGNVFDPIPNDNANGYVKNADGSFTKATKRYGLRVNGVEYALGDDVYGTNQASKEAWFEWPVEFPLKAGINKIDVFAYLGYRAKMQEFELTGLPKVEAPQPEIAQPAGTYSGTINAAGSNVFTTIALGNTKAFVELGSDKFTVDYTFNSSNGLVTIPLGGLYGNLTGTYDAANDKLVSCGVDGSTAAYVANNGSLEFVQALAFFNCEGTDAELQATFKRREGASETGLVTADTTNFISGASGVTVAGRETGDVRLNLRNDLGNGEGITASNLGFWVYNPSSSTIKLRMWVYKAADLGGNSEIASSSGVEFAPGWTFYRIGFASAKIYNIQIGDFTASGVNLTFDNISIF